MKKRWLVGIVIAAAVLGALVVWRALTATVPVRMVPVSRGPVEEFIDERGETRLDETYLVTMPFEGRVAPIVLRAGDAVTEGQLVARVVAADLDDAVAEARAAVQRLEAAIAENDDATVEESVRKQAGLFVESMVSTLAAAEARKTAGKSQLEYAQAFLKRVRGLIESGAQTQDDLEKAELAFIQSEVDYRQDVLVAESLVSLKSATDLLPQIIGQLISRKSLTRAVLEQEKAQAEARLRLAETRQQRGEMLSPVNGIVLKREVRNERFVPGGTVLMRIGQPDSLEVEADLLSEDVVRIEPGDPVRIYGPAVGADVEQGWAGTVKRIDPLAFTKISSLGVEQQRVRVVIGLTPESRDALVHEHRLGVEYRVRVRIRTSESPAALRIPRAALFRAADGGWQVFAVRDGRARLQPVEAGLMNDEVVEVKEGLALEEQVVLAPENSLEDGARVEATR